MWLRNAHSSRQNCCGAGTLIESVRRSMYQTSVMAAIQSTAFLQNIEGAEPEKKGWRRQPPLLCGVVWCGVGFRPCRQPTSESEPVLVLCQRTHSKRLRVAKPWPPSSRSSELNVAGSLAKALCISKDLAHPSSKRTQHRRRCRERSSPCVWWRAGQQTAPTRDRPEPPQKAQRRSCNTLGNLFCTGWVLLGSALSRGQLQARVYMDPKSHIPDLLVVPLDLNNEIHCGSIPRSAHPEGTKYLRLDGQSLWRMARPAQGLSGGRKRGLICLVCQGQVRVDVPYDPPSTAQIKFADQMSCAKL
jgi:hypothetical protein